MRRGREARQRDRERDQRLDSPLALHASPHTVGYIVRCDQVAFMRDQEPAPSSEEVLEEMEKRRSCLRIGMPSC